jgi:hypothetical protein
VRGHTMRSRRWVIMCLAASIGVIGPPQTAVAQVDCGQQHMFVRKPAAASAHAQVTVNKIRSLGTGTLTCDAPNRHSTVRISVDLDTQIEVGWYTDTGSGSSSWLFWEWQNGLLFDPHYVELVPQGTISKFKVARASGNLWKMYVDLDNNNIYERIYGGTNGYDAGFSAGYPTAETARLDLGVNPYDDHSSLQYRDYQDVWHFWTQQALWYDDISDAHWHCNQGGDPAHYLVHGPDTNHC